MKAVFDRSKASGGALLVHLALAEYVGNGKSDCHPSVPGLARKTRMTVRGVQKAIRSLQSIGEVEVAIREGKGRCNSYTLNLVRGEPRSVVNSTTSKGERSSGGMVSLRSPPSEPSSLNRQEPSSSLRAPKRRKKRDPYGATGQELVQYLHSEYARLYDSTEDPLMEPFGEGIGHAKRLLKARYPEAPPETLNGEKEALTWWLEHSNDGREGTRYERDKFTMMAFVQDFTSIKNRRERWVVDKKKGR